MRDWAIKELGLDEGGQRRCHGCKAWRGLGNSFGSPGGSTNADRVVARAWPTGEHPERDVSGTDVRTRTHLGQAACKSLLFGQPCPNAGRSRLPSRRRPESRRKLSSRSYSRGRLQVWAHARPRPDATNNGRASPHIQVAECTLADARVTISITSFCCQLRTRLVQHARGMASGIEGLSAQGSRSSRAEKTWECHGQRCCDTSWKSEEKPFGR